MVVMTFITVVIVHIFFFAELAKSEVCVYCVLVTIPRSILTTVGTISWMSDTSDALPTTATGAKVEAFVFTINAIKMLRMRHTDKGFGISFPLRNNMFRTRYKPLLPCLGRQNNL